MSRVVTHAVKQAALNLAGMVDKKQLGIEVEDIQEVIATASSTQPSSTLSSKVWTKDEEKPVILNTIIDQIRGLFNVGTEVTGWTVTYLGPPEHNEAKKGTYKPIETRIKAGGKGMGGRFILVVGSRDIVNLSLAVGSTDAESCYLTLPGDCTHLKITLCPVLDVYFNNINTEKLAARKGFRETLIRKNIQNRHILVFDAHVEVDAVIDKVKEMIKKD
jgi:hypothetical protein